MLFGVYMGMELRKKLALKQKLILTLSMQEKMIILEKQLLDLKSYLLEKVESNPILYAPFYYESLSGSEKDRESLYNSLIKSIFLRSLNLDINCLIYLSFLLIIKNDNALIISSFIL